MVVNKIIQHDSFVWFLLKVLLKNNWKRLSHSSFLPYFIMYVIFFLFVVYYILCCIEVSIKLSLPITFSITILIMGVPLLMWAKGHRLAIHHIRTCELNSTGKFNTINLQSVVLNLFESSPRAVDFKSWPSPRVISNDHSMISAYFNSPDECNCTYFLL